MFIFMIWIICYRTAFAIDISPQETIMDNKIVSAGLPVKERHNCNINMDYLLNEFQNLYSKPGISRKTHAIISLNKYCWNNVVFKLNGLSNSDIVANENYSNCNKIYHEQLCGMAKAQLILPLSNTCQDQYEIIHFWSYSCHGGISAGEKVIPSSFKKITISACQDEISDTLDRAVKLSYLGMIWVAVVTLPLGWLLADFYLN